MFSYWIHLIQCCQAFPFAASESKGAYQREVVIHRIISKRYALQYFDVDSFINIDDPNLLYDHYARHGKPNYNVFYLATWKDDITIIGHVDVLPGFECDDEGLDKLPILRGLCLVNVEVSKRCQRKGVGTALFEAIERDASELMEIMEKSLRDLISGVQRTSDGSVELRLYSAQSALSFYRSLDFQFDSEPWQENDGEGITSIMLLLKNLRWNWLCRHRTPHLVKRVQPTATPRDLNTNEEASRNKELDILNKELEIKRKELQIKYIEYEIAKLDDDDEIEAKIDRFRKDIVKLIYQNAHRTESPMISHE